MARHRLTEDFHNHEARFLSTNGELFNANSTAGPIARVDRRLEVGDTWKDGDL